jgi:membrane fusion protein
MESRSLFRRESVDHQRARWLGSILLVRPVAFSWLTAATLAAVALLGAFFVLGEYTKKARVEGFIAPDLGVVKVFALQSGTVTAMKVREGQQVSAGEVLALLASARTGPKAQEVQSSISRSLAERKLSLRAELDQVQKRLTQDEIAKRAAIVNMSEELEVLDQQMATQAARVDLARLAQAKYQELHKAQFISDLQLQQKSDEVLSQNAAQESLRRNRIALLRDLNSARSDLAQLPEVAQTNSSAILREISGLDEQLSESESRREATILAPENGVVTAIVAEPGQSLAVGQPMLSIIPGGAHLEAQLYAPSRAIGFIEPGRRVLLRYDAFPYQKFGQYEGVVKAISKTALGPGEAQYAGIPGEPLYRITVAPASETVTAYGRTLSLQAGMKVDADILLDRRRLIEWVFEPLYTLTGRI